LLTTEVDDRAVDAAAGSWLVDWWVERTQETLRKVLGKIQQQQGWQMMPLEHQKQPTL